MNTVKSRLDDVLDRFNPDDYGFDYQRNHMSLIESDYDCKKSTIYKSILDEIIDTITVKYDENNDIHLIDVKIQLLCVKNNQEFDIVTGTQSNKRFHGGVGLIEGSIDRYYLCFTLKLKASRLWERSYSEYQQFLYETCLALLKQGTSYNKIAAYLNDKGYKTVRNRRFRSPHVFSIVKKKQLRDVRLSRIYEPIIEDVYIKKM